VAFPLSSPDLLREAGFNVGDKLVHHWVKEIYVDIKGCEIIAYNFL